MTKMREPQQWITPTKIRYIKLGEGGEWEEDCIEKAHTLQIGFRDTNHAQCLAGKWQAVTQHFLREGHDARTASRFTNEVREFYEADERVLWITFYERSLWWCFSEPVVTLLPNKRKTRPAIDGWKCRSLDEKMLDFDHLSEKLLKMRLFKGTICKVKQDQYVLRKINGRHHPVTAVIPEEVVGTEKHLEGAVKTITVNAYERNRDARSKCIAHYGWACAVCGYYMAELYGKLGDGVIHVHHLRELASLGEEYEVDPIKDLRPVCPNCHAILHNSSPAMTIEKLRRALTGPSPSGGLRSFDGQGVTNASYPINESFMHGILYVCLPRSQARSSLHARKKVCEYLTEEGFDNQRRFAGHCDYFSVGGRYSGRLGLLRLRYENRKQFDRFWKRYWEKSISVQKAEQLFRESFPDFRGKLPICRERSGHYGDPDDAQIMDEPLFQELKAGFSEDLRYSYEINEPNVIFTEDDADFEQPKTSEEAAKFWVVLIDYHF